MIRSGSGLIVNISFWAAQKYSGNALYGCAKAATDKLTSDMAHDLAPHNVGVVTLYPGLVRTEAVMGAAEFLDLSNSESPRFIGRAIHALAHDPGRMRRSGQALVAAQLGLEYGFTDVDGRRPRPLSLGDA
jgi:dehydrogenase/reductase SDR family member 1